VQYQSAGNDDTDPFKERKKKEAMVSLFGLLCCVE
jgi:hypothetical protein